MKVLAVLTLLAGSFVCLGHAALLTGLEQQQLAGYGFQIRIVQDLLNAECPLYSKSKREEISDIAGTDIEVNKLPYQQLLQELIKCRSTKGKPGFSAGLNPKGNSSFSVQDIF